MDIILKKEKCMGYLSAVAIHIIGEKTKFFTIQENFFQQLKLSNIQDKDLFFINTDCLDREEYKSMGRALWFKIKWEGINEKLVEGKFFAFEVKWGYYWDQWERLSQILSQYSFSWQFLRNGQEDNDLVKKINQEELRDSFEKSVITHYTLDTLKKLIRY